MMKQIAPIWGKLRHLQRPQMFTVHAHPSTAGDRPTVGQRLAEQVAAFVGSWLFLGGQAFFLFLWLVYNTLIFTRHFDSFPYILLNLVLSFQAAFTGPVLLIAANVGAVRDHKQSDRIEHLTTQNEDLAERLLNVERMLEKHVTQSLAKHAAELSDLSVMMRAVHATVCPPPSPDGAATASASLAAETGAPAAAALADPPVPGGAAPAIVERASSPPARARGRPAPGGAAPRRSKGT
jgi:uncharacterized membrane protein